MSKNKSELIPLSRIKCVPDRKITAEASKKLQTSMESRIARGLKPLIVPLLIERIDEEDFDYNVVDGKCRYLALEKIQCEGLMLGGDMPDMVFAEGDSRILSFAANDNRNNLTLQQQVDIINALVEEGKTVDGIADEIGMSTNWVAKRANLNRLIKNWQEAMKDTRYPWMSVGHYEIIAMFSVELQEKIFDHISWNQYQYRKLSVKKFEAALCAEFSTLLSKLPWNADGSEQGCGECPACQDRLNNGFLFSDMNDSKKARCQNKEYLANKCRLYIAEQVRENPELVLIAYNADSCKIEDTGDPLYGLNIIPPGHWTECKPSKGGVKAIAIDSPQAGAAVNVKVSKSKKNSAETETEIEDVTAGKTKTLAERKEAKHKQRQRYAINMLIDFIKALEYELPNRDSIFALVACMGVNSAVHWYGDDEKEFFTKKYGDSEISCYSKVLEQPNLDKAVWKKVCENIVSELNYGQSGGDKSAKWAEAEIIAELIKFDLTKALEEATTALPDPKSWLQLEKLEAAAKAA